MAVVLEEACQGGSREGEALLLPLVWQELLPEGESPSASTGAREARSSGSRVQCMSRGVEEEVQGIVTRQSRAAAVHLK